MKFSLIQLLLCVGIIFVVTILLINTFHAMPNKAVAPVSPGVTIPFMNIKMK